MKKEEILKLYKEYRVPLHVIAHMKKVAQVCEILADTLNKKGIKTDKKALMDAALLHDVLRICDFLVFEPENFPQKAKAEDIKIWKELRKKYKKKGHVKAIAEILEKRGEHEIANLIRKHDFFEVNNLKTWEEKIIYYADKRVDKDKIVSLDERFHEGRKRNLNDENIEELLLETEMKVKKLEQEFIDVLGDLPV